MRYVTVGSGTAVPQVGRSAPCHLVQTGDRNIVVDLGPGASWEIPRRGGVPIRDIHLVLITHLHMDHCADLAPLLFALRSREAGRADPLRILGPRGLKEHYEKLRLIWEHRIEPDGYEMSLEEWEGDAIRWQGCKIEAAPTMHSVLNLAWCVESGTGRIVLTGDGEGTDELRDLARSAPHSLVAECAVPPGASVDGHMNPAQAAEFARACRSERLILGHINPGSDSESILREAKAHFDGEITVAEDGMEIDLN